MGSTSRKPLYFVSDEVQKQMVLEAVVQFSLYEISETDRCNWTTFRLCIQLVAFDDSMVVYEGRVLSVGHFGKLLSK